MEYYEIIKALREDKDMTQEELCKALNISQQSLSKYEKNGSNGAGKKEKLRRSDVGGEV